MGALEAYLQDNATTDFAPGRDKIKFIKDGLPMYQPNLFHCAKTIDYPYSNGHIPFLVKDVLGCTQCKEIYGVDGFQLGHDGYAMLGNHPVKKLKIRGRVSGETYTEYNEKVAFYLLYINDGSSSQPLTVKVSKEVYLSEPLRFQHNTHLMVEVRGHINFYYDNLEFEANSLEVVGHREEIDIELEWLSECLEFRNRVLVEPWIINENDTKHTVQLNFSYEEQGDYRDTEKELKPHSISTLKKANLHQDSNKSLPFEDSIYIARKNQDPEKSSTCGVDSSSVSVSDSQRSGYAMVEESFENSSQTDEYSLHGTDNKENTTTSRDFSIAQSKVSSNISSLDEPKEKVSQSSKRVHPLSPKANATSMNRDQTHKRKRITAEDSECSDELIIPIVKTPKLVIEIIKACLKDSAKDSITSKDLYMNAVINSVLDRIVMGKILSETVKLDDNDELIIQDGTFSKISDAFSPDSVESKKKQIFLDCLFELAKNNIIYFTKAYNIITTNLLRLIDSIATAIKWLMTSQETQIKKLIENTRYTKLTSPGVHKYLTDSFDELVSRVLDLRDMSNMLSEEFKFVGALDQSLMKALISWVIFESDRISKGGFVCRTYNIDDKNTVEINWIFIQKINTSSFWEYKPSVVNLVSCQSNS